MNYKDYQEKTIDFLRQGKDELYSLGEKLFNEPELGFKEVNTHTIMADYLTRKGINHEDIALTGLRTTLGEKGRHIAIITDMDAVLVNSAQGPRPFHSCGHSIQNAVALSVLAALHETSAAEGLGGRVSLIATPAEEYIDLDYRRGLIQEGRISALSGKQEMILQGVFDDVDAALSLHISGDPHHLFDVESSLTGFYSKKARFQGRAAHSGALAHEGRNALHGASLFLQTCAFLAEQFPRDAGVEIHPVIAEAAHSANVIPDRVALESYIRANDQTTLLSAGEKFDNAALHIALALELQCEIESLPGYLPFKQDPLLCDTIYQYMTPLYPPEKIARGLSSGASGDIGDISYLLPAAQFGFTGFKGRIHSDEFAIIDKRRAYLEPAIILANAILDLLGNPEQQPKKRDYEERKAFYMRNWLKRDAG